MQQIRLTTVFILILLLCAVVAAACTNDDGPSNVAETPLPAEPTPDVEAIVEAAVRGALQAIPTQAPASTPDVEAVVETVLERAMDNLLEAMATVRSVEKRELLRIQSCRRSRRGKQSKPRLFLAPTSGAFVSFGSTGFDALSIAKEFSEAGGLTVTAVGSVTISANEAYVIVIPEQLYGPVGPEKLSHEDRDDVKQNLLDIGIGVDEIEFESGQQYDPETISVEVQIDDLPDIGELILDAVEKVTRRTERSGALFGVIGQECDQALAAARQEAITRAEGDSLDLAEALGVVPKRNHNCGRKPGQQL